MLHLHSQVQARTDVVERAFGERGVPLAIMSIAVPAVRTILPMLIKP